MKYILAAVALTAAASAAPAIAQGDAAVKQKIIEQSIAAYPGNCPCPYNTDRAGRRCGKRSAWSREGGHAPLCYPSDVTRADVQRYRASR